MAIGPPISPPDTMPIIAADTASVAAPLTPASSKSGAKASPVAGPPVSVTDPASTPISGCSPSAHATPAPTTFCSAAATDATIIMTSTSGPPRASTRTLAPKPTEAKNVFCSGTCSAVSKATNGGVPRLTKARSTAIGSPPTTGAGML